MAYQSVEDQVANKDLLMYKFSTHLFGKEKREPSPYDAFESAESNRQDLERPTIKTPKMQHLFKGLINQTVVRFRKLIPAACIKWHQKDTPGKKYKEDMKPDKILKAIAIDHRSQKNDSKSPSYNSTTLKTKPMETLKFKDEFELRDFYLQQGYVAIHYCDTYPDEIEIDHYNLLKSGEHIDSICYGRDFISLNDEIALNIIKRFLYTGQTIIHPKHFSIQ